MQCVKRVPFTLVLRSVKLNCFQRKHNLVSLCNINIRSESAPIVKFSIMAQRSITSFFTTAQKKSTDVEEEAAEFKKTSKRQRIESSGSETTSPKKTATPVSENKKVMKRQRIESSSSEASAASPVKTTPSPENITQNSKTATKLLKTSNKTKKEISVKKSDSLNSSNESMNDKTTAKESKSRIKTKKEISINKSDSLNSTNESIDQETQEIDSKSIKNENISSPENSPIKSSTKKSKDSVKVSKNLKEKDSKSTKVKSDKSKKDAKSPLIEKNVKETKNMSFFFKKDKSAEEEAAEKKNEGLVSEHEYNPSLAKYDPVRDACWARGSPVPYLALARTLDCIEGTSARLKIVDTLANYLRSVMALTPEDMLPSVYLCLNQLAPAYEGVELGIAETYIMKAIGACTGRTLAQMKGGVAKSGDLGLLAEQARSQQRTMFASKPIQVRKLFDALTEIARMSGQASVNKKIAKIQSLFVACRYSEARYLIRSLEGKLRIGLAEQSVLQAIAVAAAHHADPGLRKLPTDAVKARIEEYSSKIKCAFCECPNYSKLIPCLLNEGVEALAKQCKLTPGVPPRPMLAHPTASVLQLFNRFEGIEFTCEWKYDGERAQIHVPERDGRADLANATIFSRNQENNTSKYPDVLARLPKLLKDDVTSCILDCEAVAYDPEKKQILPFQVLSTRKRKDAVMSEVCVRVCVFVFDVLLLNGDSLVGRPLRARRDLLRSHFAEVEDEWQFATSKDCSTMEEVQQFLEEAVKGSCEGLMVKTLAGDHATYEISKRSHNWLKLKKDYLEGVGDTLDLVVIGGYYGKGKRAGVLGGFLLACFDPTTEEYQSICKIGTGFSDENLALFTKQLLEDAIDHPKSYYRYDASHSADVWLPPGAVWEVRCADVTLSPAHRAAAALLPAGRGASLRFPRFVRVREDKTPEQATTAQQIAEMYLAQDIVKNNQGNSTVQDEDYY